MCYYSLEGKPQCSALQELSWLKQANQTAFPAHTIKHIPTADIQCR
jgi:hypothetical protein